ncbi:MAG TPA: pyridoxal 5'-phosphate synthase glutaminase subunit PdxT [Kouleothrix sp.]|uniref:pyridoxal 5'-phosphate synthase glutaminase subunit PdxT n=1 Tax=Kouleothrix sp. TaxID=2779161 RepID=UPI002CC269DB|nr:pyridoxal 5'-phosphate synthase glutaminase subunit PdxT [Kouleothrix sp.]HRC74639.1 pyridoxal 5'-phosphate synthase glutaminase subunit PdxT [Kouleothrix sp.]
MTIGILALQGDFREHEAMLQRIGAPTLQVRLPKHLAEVDRLIIPGGESTAIGKLLVLYGLLEPIRERGRKGMPIWGTCAGAILLAQRIAEGRPAGQPALALMDITARRNAFGRQLDSFEVNLSIEALGDAPLNTVFIRAPLIEQPGPAVRVLATLADGRIVAAQQGHLLATCFHPELTGDERFHRYFLEL